jgi:5-methylcytosine-specific restriction protein B
MSFLEKLNHDAQVLFDRFADESERQWARDAIESIQRKFPDTDSWTTGGVGKKYIDIRFGRKTLGNAKGQPVILLDVIRAGAVRLRMARLYRRDLKIQIYITRATCPDRAALEKWIRDAATHLQGWPQAMKGQGRAPTDYGASEDVERVDTPEEEPSPDAPAARSNFGVISDIPLNQILYGPPGTGKTFHTITHAMGILEPDLVDDYLAQVVSREELVKAFRQYLEAGQIVFCTFHQSFSYEDFVEGLRASTVNGQLSYAVEPGVFKQLCERAALGTTAKDDPFDKAVAKLLELCSEAETRPMLSTVKNKRYGIQFEGNKTFRVFPESSEVENPYYVANIENVRKLYQGHDKKGMYNASYVEGMLNYLKTHCELREYQPVQEDPSDRRKFVLVIDEINRGNVSRIFGELITLIEPSKRKGASEELSVLLPYSKERFSVPSNVYIIGTMNTADRSLAALDIALRRRFTFREMPPEPASLADISVEGVNLALLLDTINQRIEVLLDRDHCLGHAYFMKLSSRSSLSDLAIVFEQQILPLLQEYFFEDWERIRWVLNDHRKPNRQHRFIVEPAGAKLGVATLFGQKLAETLQDARWLINAEAFLESQSYIGIYSIDGNAA